MIPGLYVSTPFQGTLTTKKAASKPRTVRIRHLSKTVCSPITRTNRGGRLSERLQQRPNIFTLRLSSGSPAGFRSDQSHCFRVLQPLKYERGIHVLQGVVSCCLEPLSTCKPQAIPMPSITQSRSNKHLSSSGFLR